MLAKVEREKRRRAGTDSNSTLQAKYRADPVAFGRDELGEWYAAEIETVMESVRDYPVTIVRSCNAFGKTHGAARVAVWFYLMHDDAQVYTTAAPPMSNLRRLLWGEIGSIVQAHPDLFAEQAVRTMHIERSPRSFVTGVAIPTSGTEAQREAKFAGKHAPHILFIVDEGDAVPEEVYRGIESCMSGGDARLLIMYNPRNQSGPVWIKERDKLANIVTLSALDHPNVRSGADGKAPGAVTRAKVVARMNLWSSPLVDGEKPDDECFEVPSFLVGETAEAPNGQMYPPLPAGWRRVTNPALWYMVFGQYPTAGANQLISRSWLSAARARWDAYAAQHGTAPPIGAPPVMGLDVADLGGDANAACFRHGGWVAPLVTWGGVDVIATGDRAAALYAERDADKANVDGTGVGAGVAPYMMRKGCSAWKVMVGSKPTRTTEEGEFAQLRDQLWWMCREWLRTDPGAMLPPDEALLEELAAPAYSVKGGKVKVMDKDTMRALLKRSPDRADALCLTFAEAGVVGFA